MRRLLVFMAQLFSFLRSLVRQRPARSTDLVHELAQPLTVATFELEALRLRTETPQVETTLKALEHMRELLHLSREQLPVQRLQPIQFSATAHVQSMLRVLKPSADSNHVLLLFSPRNDLQSIWLRGNPTQFQQVVRNLVMNAIEAYPVDETASNRVVVIELEVVESVIESNVVLKVQDFGRGIPRGVLGRIFDLRFTTKTDSSSHGLGLSITRKLVEEYFHGSIAVESEVGKGTVFTVTLPRSEEKDVS